MFFDIGMGIHIESQLNMFHFVDDISSKMEVFPMSAIWVAAISCKTAISCTPVSGQSTHLLHNSSIQHWNAVFHLTNVSDGQHDVTVLF
jgi:hypothetical protein